MIKKVFGIFVSAALVLSLAVPAFASEIQSRHNDPVKTVADAVLEGAQAGYDLGMSVILTPADMAR